MKAKQKTLVVFYPGCTDFEILTAAQILNEKFPIEVATQNGEPFLGSTGFWYLAQKRYSEVDINDYACVLLPGGNPESMLDNEQFGKLFRDAFSKNIIIGAMCSSPMLLAKHGLLKGRSYTHAAIYPKDMQDIFEDSSFVKEFVVVDGNLVTSQPFSQAEFAVELGKKLSIFECEEEANAHKEYFKGNVQLNWADIGPVIE